MVEQWTNRPVVWPHACHSHSNFTTPPSSLSINCAPSPSYLINLKLGKNIKQQPYNGSPANQGTVAP